MNTNFRHEARQALIRANALLELQDDHSVTYAALNLRMAMEAIIYDKAQAYKEELPKDIYKTWQPRKILQTLLEIDPKADKVVSLSIGFEEAYGVPAKQMISLGTDTPLSLANLKQHYDAIGSYLHTPTIKQIEDGKAFEAARLRQRCIELSEILKKVLESAFFNSTIGQFLNGECHRCGEKIRKRVDLSRQEDVIATCIHCNAQHKITFTGHIANWTPNIFEVPCSHQPCDGKIRVFKDEIIEGNKFICEVCNQVSAIAYCLTALPGLDAPKETDN